MLEVLSNAGVGLHGHRMKRLPHNPNVRFDGIDGKAIITSVSEKIAISAGSACTTQVSRAISCTLGIRINQRAGTFVHQNRMQ